MKAFYTDHFPLPLPEGHRFPMEKYSRLRERVRDMAAERGIELVVPPAASREELVRAHDPDYIRRIAMGELTGAEIRRLGFPWSPEMVERSRRSAGATISACRAAADEGVAVSLAGGTHHAFRDRGEGYCVFNDTAVAARAMQAEGVATRVLVVDCDVHQGNGTAAIFGGDPSVFTFSIHGAKNFPFRKERSDLDVELPDGADDATYLSALESGLWVALERSRAEAGVRAVCAVDGDAKSREVRPEALEDVRDVEVCHVLDALHRTASRPGGVEERFDLLLVRVHELAAVPVEELDAVVLGGVVRGRDHRADTLCHERDRGRGQHAAELRRPSSRDDPALDATSRLSPYLKVGALHPRTLLADLAPDDDAFRRELAWREFYAAVLYHRPSTARTCFQPHMEAMRYDHGSAAESRFAAWAEGRTGFPLVDAGMRQLRAEGWMHNRLRMITASFLVKDLHIDWRRGARHFMANLVDGDLASNQHNWQWVAGTGTDAAPYFRVFNPVSQSRKVDPNGDYISRWVPELSHLSSAEIHEPWRRAAGVPADYPERIVEHSEERAESLARHEALRAQRRG
jgi:hypothetical protein